MLSSFYDLHQLPCKLCTVHLELWLSTWQFFLSWHLEDHRTFLQQFSLVHSYKQVQYLCAGLLPRFLFFLPMGKLDQIRPNSFFVCSPCPSPTDISFLLVSHSFVLRLFFSCRILRGTFPFLTFEQFHQQNASFPQISLILSLLFSFCRSAFSDLYKQRNCQKIYKLYQVLNVLLENFWRTGIPMAFL